MKKRDSFPSAKNFMEAADIALIVGRSIIIPHLRRMFKEWDLLQEGSDE